MNEQGKRIVMPGRRRFLAGAAAVGCFAVGRQAWAAGPADPIRLVIPYPAGGGTDIIGRLFAASAGEQLKRHVVPENHGGASGLIGIQVVARGEPVSVMGISGIGTSVTLALTQKNMPYVIGRDLDAIAHLGEFGNLIVTRPDAPFKDLQGLIAAAKARNKPFFCGTPARGSPSHLTLQYLCAAAGVEISAVPYQGHAAIMNDLLGGQLDMALLSVPLSAKSVDAGMIRALAVTSAQRSVLLPQVPTAHEAGLSGFEASLWNVLVTATGASRETLEQINRATNAGFMSPAAQATLKTAGVDFRPHTLDETRAFVEREKQKWARITEQAGIVAE
jgi:tripartite-type tricarboxylate transporter receptor subunit TctC